MDIAYTIASGRGDTDLILQRTANMLIAEGFCTICPVQINSEREDAGHCDMDIKVLPSGSIIRISQSLGREAKGCRLDPSALETAVAQVQQAMAQGADCLIINKFGKHEAEGRGFRPLIAEALSLGIPVLIGTNRLNLSAFDEFTEGLATNLRPEVDTLYGWLRNAVDRRLRAA